MDLLERVVYFGLGGAVGFVLGLIVARLRVIKEEVDEVLEIERQNNGLGHNERGMIRLPAWPNVAVALVVLLTAYAAFVSQKTSNDFKADNEEEFISRCQAGVDNRNVQRELVEAVYNLATGAAKRDENSPPLTPELIRQYNAYISRVNEFRSGMYDKIQPSKDCAPYVDDNNVKPPSDPFPTIPSTKETR